MTVVASITVVDVAGHVIVLVVGLLAIVALETRENREVAWIRVAI